MLVVLMLCLCSKSNAVEHDQPRRLPPIENTRHIDPAFRLASSESTSPPPINSTSLSRLPRLKPKRIPEPESLKPMLPVVAAEDTSSYDVVAQYIEAPPAEVLENAAFADDTYPIDLSTALGLGGANHLQVRLARSKTAEAQAEYLRAKAHWLPSLRFAIAYNQHEGHLQSTDGDVVEVSRSSLFVGGGIGPQGGGPLTAGAGGPPRMFVSWSLADAAFEPLAACQQVSAAAANSQVALNDSLRDIALAYYDLVEAYSLLAGIREAESAAMDAIRTLEAFEVAGKGSKASIVRARVLQSSLARQAVAARGQTKAKSAQLARQLRLPPTTQLLPIEEVILPVDFVSGAVGDINDATGLIAQAYASRPELRKYAALQQAACWRVKQERLRPWLPILHVGASGGAFGGGPGSDFPNADGRSDLDLVAVWELQNMGLGNVANLRQRRSQFHQIELEWLDQRDRIAAQVAATAAAVGGLREQTTLAQETVALAAETVATQTELIRQDESEPLELFEALKSLTMAGEEYVHAAAEYNRTQYRLMWATGSTISAAGTVTANH